MGLFEAASANPLGLHPGRPQRVRAIYHGTADAAGVKGECVRFDLEAGDAATTAATTFGGTTDPTSIVIQTAASEDGTAVDAATFFYAILSEAVNDGDETWVYIRGVVEALCGDTSAPGIGLSVEDPGNGELILAPVNGRVIAVSLDTNTDGGLHKVAFNGIEGFGIRGV